MAGDWDVGVGYGGRRLMAGPASNARVFSLWHYLSAGVARWTNGYGKNFRYKSASLILDNFCAAARASGRRFCIPQRQAIIRADGLAS